MRSPKRRNSAILWGGYGWGNVGDELTLAVAIAELREQGFLNLTILTPTPGYTRALFPDLAIIPFNPVRRNGALRRVLSKTGRRLFGITLPEPRLLPEWQTAADGSWVSAIRQADCLYLVGGGYFSSLFTLFDRFLLPVEVAKSCGTPVVTAPLGIGPIQDRKLAGRFARAFQGASLCVRDESSADFCRKNGLEVSIRPDDGFRVGKILEFENHAVTNDGEIVLGVNFFPQHGARDQSALRSWWCEFLEVASRNHVTIEGFCFHNRIFEDFEAMVELFASAGLPPVSVKPPFLDFRDACRNLSRYSIIASCRFHAVVVANATGTPCLGVSDGDYYHAKMNAACEGSERAHHIRLPGTNPSEAFELLMAKNRAPKS